MAPAARASRRQSSAHHGGEGSSSSANDEIFLDPMLGTPLAIYVDKDVQDRDAIVELIVKHGGSVSPGYSGVPHILVDPHKESGQSLYRQYAGKKGKIILDARWVYECVNAGSLQVFNTNWAGCKVTGNEQVTSAAVAGTSTQQPESQRRGRPRAAPPQQQQQAAPTTQAPQSFTPVVQQPPAQPLPPPPNQTSAIPNTSTMVPPPPGFPPYVYPRNAMPPPPSSAPPQTWQGSNGIAPHQTHITQPPQPPPPHPQMMHRHTHPYAREDQWASTPFQQMGTEPPPMSALSDGQSTGYYDPRFRDDQQQQHGWPEHPHEYYAPPQHFDPNYHHADPYMPIPGPTVPTQPAVTQEQPAASTSAVPAERPRGRKRARVQAVPAPPASTLVLNRKNPPARSPTPPTRVIKSTYGGNLFTADDIEYLKRYIDYCQEQGLVLSLREICERIAVKAPHHTFYSWRRYCNKHQIRLGGYTMDVDDRSPSPNNGLGDDEVENADPATNHGQGLFTIADAHRALLQQGVRNRSPTPPRALFRSTTGKGVAFTEEDVTFLCKFLAYRKSQGRLDMVTFWKDVATKAPHHSRASWMKYYRRHKHELNRIDGDAPLPAPPAKKMRYGRSDDILLAQYFMNKPEGTSDKIFQEFARVYPHHPWKGWQEHHRIHKAKIDHFIQKLLAGDTIEPVSDEE